GVDRLPVDEIEIARQPHDTVRVGAAQVGPDQDLGPFLGVIVADASGGEDRGGKSLQVGLADLDRFFAHGGGLYAEGRGGSMQPHHLTSPRDASVMLPDLLFWNRTRALNPASGLG